MARGQAASLADGRGRTSAPPAVVVALGLLLAAVTYGLVSLAVREVRLAADGVTRPAQVVESYPKGVTARLQGTTTVVDLIAWQGQPEEGTTISLVVLPDDPSTGQEQGALPWAQGSVGTLLWLGLAAGLEAAWRGERAVARRVADRLGLREPLPLEPVSRWVVVNGSPSLATGRPFRVLRKDQQVDVWDQQDATYQLDSAGSLTVFLGNTSTRSYRADEWLEVQALV